MLIRLMTHRPFITRQMRDFTRNMASASNCADSTGFAMALATFFRDLQKMLRSAGSLVGIPRLFFSNSGLKSRPAVPFQVYLVGWLICEIRVFMRNTR